MILMEMSPMKMTVMTTMHLHFLPLQRMTPTQRMTDQDEDGFGDNNPSESVSSEDQYDHIPIKPADADADGFSTCDETAMTTMPL